VNQIGNKSEKYYERLSDHGGRAIAITRQSIEDTRREYQAGKIWEAGLNCPMQKNFIRYLETLLMVIAVVLMMTTKMESNVTEELIEGGNYREFSTVTHLVDRGVWRTGDVPQLPNNKFRRRARRIKRLVLSADSFVDR